MGLEVMFVRVYNYMDGGWSFVLFNLKLLTRTLVSLKAT